MIVRWTWHRSLLILVVEQLAFALAVVFAGGILMLLLGTQILDWYWLTLLSVTAFAVSIVRVRNRMLTPYRIAQTVDRRLRLNDSLSTAWFLLTEAGSRNDEAARFQIEQAEQVAASLKPSMAFPFRRDRSWALAGALGAAMFGLFAVRYLVQSSLSFEQSLIPIQLGSALERIERSLSFENPAVADPAEPEQDPNPAKLGQLEQNSERADVPRSDDSNSGQQLNPTNSTESTTRNIAGQENRESEDSKSKNAESSESQQRNPADNTTRENRDEAKTAAANTDKEMPGNQPSPSGLLNKMKDAVSSLLAKMKSPATSKQAAQSSERPPDGNRTEQKSAANNEQQGPSSNAGKERARNDLSSEAREQGQTREKAEASQGRNSDQSPDKNGSDAHSGIGRQNGDKELKEAEQLQAMGKLAEIIGKRSANLTGEVTVETSSGKQRLKTDDSQRVGQHSDLGGEINRDEIPLIYQQYVREYMERVQKQAKNSH